MSEKLSHSPESHQSKEKLHEVEQSPEKHTPKSKENEPKHHEKKTDLESIKKSIETTAVSGKEYSVGEKESTDEGVTHANTKQIKKSAYRKVIKQAQSQMKGVDKSFSKFIHKPTVEKVSDVSARTVARPTSLLFGSVFAFIASLIFYIFAKRSGFEYNYLLFLMVFIGGYFVGLIFELLTWIVKKPSGR